MNLAVIRFHLLAGVRLALRAMVPILIPFIAAVGLSPSPSAFMAAIAVSTATNATDPGILFALAAVSIGITTWAAPRLTHGLDGWIRHLPASGADHRRAAAAALGVAQAPVLLLIAILALGMLASGTVPLSPAKIAGLPILAIGASYAALPVKRRALVAPVGIAALLLSLTGAWAAVIAGAALIAAADALSGPLRPARRSRRFRPMRVLPEMAVIAWRAVRVRSLAAIVVGLVPPGIGALFLMNNPLSAAAEGMAVRLAALAGMTWTLAALAQSLAVRRPAWPWARSLPWSSADRIRADAIFLGAHALAIAGMASFLDPWSAIAAAAAIPFLALRSAGAIRSGIGDRAGAIGRVFAEGMTVSLAVALLPWAALLALAAAPIAHRAAVRSERNCKVTRFAGLHHRAAGDPLSWSA